MALGAVELPAKHGMPAIGLWLPTATAPSPLCAVSGELSANAVAMAAGFRKLGPAPGVLVRRTPSTTGRCGSATA
jgi:hypothetical protein